MYEDHFGLTGRPFQLTPDPHFWFETATHRKAMAYLGYGLAQGEGFIVVTGDIGAGKTTLVGHLMERIDATRLNPIRIVSTQIEADDLLRIVAGGLGIEPAGRSKAELLVAVERALHGVARTGRRTLLIVDEVQALPVSALEELRMLSNFQAGGHALLQILLLGQPEFRERLSGSDRLEQLRQRVIATHHLDPMEPGEVEAYVAHRLSLVGWKGRPDFADDAFPALYGASGGVPRRLNQLASRVLLHCAVEGLELIDGAVVRAVADDGITDARSPEPDVAATPEPLPAPVPVPMPAPVSEPATVPAEATPVMPTADAGPGAADPVAADPVAADPVSPDMAPSVEPAAEPATPRPMTPPQPRAGPRPIRLALAPEPEAIVPDPEPQPVMRETDAVPPTGDPVARQPTTSPVDEARIAALEARLEVQDAALRRVLTLLVDWVENDGPRDGRAELAGLRDAAA